MAQLIVALDVPNARQAYDLADRLQGIVPWLKVGLELYVAAGPRLLTALGRRGFRIFLDLKFHDIPNTVAGAVRSAARVGAHMLTLHVASGPRALAAAVEARREVDAPILLYAVTVLTSLSPEECREVYRRPPEMAAMDMAGVAAGQGLDGVVCSVHEAGAIKGRHDRLGCLTPGIRLERDPLADQRRTATPEAAVAAGSDFLVVGRPITRAPDPAQAARIISQRMATPAAEDTP